MRKRQPVFFPDGQPESLRYSLLLSLIHICRRLHGRRYERFDRSDRSGYPDGLKGDQIQICAQVVGLVDDYDALVSERPYKRKLRHGEAVRMIINGECLSLIHI